MVVSGKKALFAFGVSLLVTGINSERALANVPPTQAHGQSTSAQQLLRDDLERERLREELRQRQQIIEKTDEEPLIDDGGAEEDLKEKVTPKLSEQQGPTFVLDTITIEPVSELLETEALAGVRQAYEGREVNFNDLKSLVADINKLYLEAGHVNARAYLPPQDIKGGQLKVALIEGKLGLLTYTGNDTTWDWMIDWQVGVEPGEVMDLPELSDDLEWLNRTSGFGATAKLGPGANFGETDLELTIIEPPKYDLKLIYDNWGTESSGQHRGSIFFSSPSLLGFRDQFSVNYTLTENEKTAWGQYSFPVNPWNGRLGMSLSRSRVDVTNQNFADISIIGRSIDRSITFDQPFFLYKGLLLTANGAWGDVRSRTYIDGDRVVSTDLRENVYGMTAEYIGEQSFFTTRAKHARLREKDSAGRTVAEVWSGNYAFLYRFFQKWSVVSAGGWQYTEAVLVPSGRLFQIGGTSTVRGYLAGALSGNKGYYNQFEVHRTLPYGFDAFTFFDTGFADPFAEISKAYGYISSFGAGTNWSWGPLSAQVAYGHAMNHERYVDQKSGEWHMQVVLDVLKGWDQIGWFKGDTPEPDNVARMEF